MRHARSRLLISAGLTLGLGLLFSAASAQNAAPQATATPTATGDKPVIAAGTVPDEATKAAVLTRLRELYGAQRVVDRIEVDAVVAPPNWSQHVVNMLGPDLQQVSAGKLEINGNAVRVSGQIGNEAQRQQVISTLATRLNSSYSVDGRGLRAGGGAKQTLLDQALADRIIEFQSGSATLTPVGTGILDQMAAAMRQIGSTRVQVIGHTDALGARDSNVALSMARAAAVKAYLEQNGVGAGNLSVQGLGPDQPVADNATVAGRARNRRIEFRVL